MTKCENCGKERLSNKLNDCYFCDYKFSDVTCEADGTIIAEDCGIRVTYFPENIIVEEKYKINGLR